MQLNLPFDKQYAHSFLSHLEFSALIFQSNLSKVGLHCGHTRKAQDKLSNQDLGNQILEKLTLFDGFLLHQKDIVLENKTNTIFMQQAINCHYYTQ